MVELRAVDKTYGTPQNPLPVLRALDLRVATGEFVAVVGASGSGKSTLLNIVGCLDRPTAGHYLLVGEDVSRLDDVRLSHVRRTRIGFVFQSFHLVPHLTVEENVELPLFYNRIGRRERRARSAQILDRVGLGHRRTHMPNQLSGGECQRTAVARALVNRPSLLLADEPTGNLDSVTTREIMRLFTELHGAGCTIVMITHDLGVADVAGRRIRMRDGRIEHDDGSAAPAAAEGSCSAN
ncbi:MAG: ABC transporter ATP-binding protein [Planctomycetes bacterium]|nr:ABC transporter ATP-binding protein [Planctomycetota bacterium]